MSTSLGVGKKNSYTYQKDNNHVPVSKEVKTMHVLKDTAVQNVTNNVCIFHKYRKCKSRKGRVDKFKLKKNLGMI